MHNFNLFHRRTQLIWKKMNTPEPTERSIYWLPDLHLTLHDQETLASGQWLSDKHTAAVNTLSRQQYPHQNGLQSTLQLSKYLQWISESRDFVQIVHISQNHWVCMSNLMTPADVVEVFDSMSPTYDIALTRQVAAIIRYSGPQFTLCYITVQYQSGRDDCGLFASALILLKLFVLARTHMH